MNLFPTALGVEGDGVVGIDGEADHAAVADNLDTILAR